MSERSTETHELVIVEGVVSDLRTVNRSCIHLDVDVIGDKMRLSDVLSKFVGRKVRVVVEVSPAVHK
jgi:hypothetical protein